MQDILAFARILQLQHTTLALSSRRLTSVIGCRWSLAGSLQVELMRGIVQSLDYASYQVD